MNLVFTLLSLLAGLLVFPLGCHLIPNTLFGGLLFYRGLLAALTCFVLHFVLMLFLKRKYGVFNVSSEWGINALSIAVIAMCFNVCFLVVFPVTVDRSVTTFLLEEIEKSDSMTPNKLEEIFINEYIIKRQAIDRRIYEQLVTGNIKVTNNNVSLSARGRNFMKFSRLIRWIFQLPDRTLAESNSMVTRL